MKRKDSVALFEVISKGRVKRPAEAEADFNPPEVDAAPVAREAEPKSPGDASAKRLSFSLNYASCVAAGLGLVVLLGTMFWLGRITGSKASPAGEAQEGSPVEWRQQDSPQPQGAGPGAAGQEQPARIAGMYYLIIDRMATGLTESNRLDAEAIIEWLKTQGHDATIAQTRDRYLVLSLKPFENPRSQEATDYAAVMDNLGKQYRAAPPRAQYTFSQTRRDASGRRVFDPSYYRWDN